MAFVIFLFHKINKGLAMEIVANMAKLIGHYKLIAIIFILFVSPFTGYADEVKSKTFVIGVEEISYYPLYDFTVKDTTKPSFTRDLLAAFFTKYHYNFRFVALPLKRFDKWFIEKNIDFKFPDNKRWRADGGKTLHIIYSDPVLKLMAGSFVHKSKQHIKRDQVRSLSTILGFYPTLWLDKLTQGKVKLYEETNTMGIVKHILNNDYDVTNIDLNVINHKLQTLNKPGEIVLNKQIPHQTYFYHLSTIAYPEVLKQFNQFLKTEHLFVQSLKDKYQLIEDF
jgi:hypothetical protein